MIAVSSTQQKRVDKQPKSWDWASVVLVSRLLVATYRRQDVISTVAPTAFTKAMPIGGTR
jgi:hypothetical protein